MLNLSGNFPLTFAIAVQHVYFLLNAHFPAMCRRSTRQRKDVDYSEANALVSLDDVKTRGSKLENVS